MKHASRMKLKMLVGTYTDGNDSRGVYLYSFDQEEGLFALLDTATAGNPSMVIPGENGIAYSVGEYEDGRQCACCYRLTDSTIKRLNQQTTDGAYSGSSPCNIALAGGCAITANYGGGSLSVFPIGEDGTLLPMSGQFAPEGNGTARMHCAVVSPDGRYLFATDLGHDAIYRFMLREGNPLSEPETAYQFDRSLHPGPRHMVFSQDGRFAYLVHEKQDLLSVFRYEDGLLTHLSTQLAYDGAGHGSADIHIHPNGQFLYTSHRLQKDGISIWRLAPDGSATRIGYQPTGIHPRNFAITPNGRFLLCACRDSHRIEIYRIAEDGMLEPTGKQIELPAPVSIRFAIDNSLFGDASYDRQSRG